MMVGLFERDFTQLTAEELQEKEKIETENGKAFGGKYGKENCMHKYPKAVRHSLSLFPNNYMDIQLLKEKAELENQCDGFENLLNDTSITELDIKRYIQNNRYYHIPASIFCYYPFGHHEAALFKEFQLGTSYKADYLLAGRGSGGWQFIFVEFEKPYGFVTLADGSWGTTVRNGLNQIEDWKTFIESNYSTIYSEFEKYTKKDLPKDFVHFDSTRMHYVVVAGRRVDFDNEKSRRLQRSLYTDSDIRLLHYDNLLDNARELIGARSY